MTVTADEPELVTAVRDLTKSVNDLKALVEQSLSKEEAAQVYTSKAESRQRRTRAVVLVLVAVLIALFVTTSATFGAMNYCFFTGNNGQRGFTREGICNAIPGYDSTQQEIASQRAITSAATAALAATAQQNAVTNEKQDEQLAAILVTLQRLETKLGIPQ